MANETLRKGARVVSFFTSSHFWGSELRKRAKAAGLQHGLATYSASRWYSISKLCLSLHEHKESSRQLRSHYEYGKNKVGVPADVRGYIEDRDFWSNNEVSLTMHGVYLLGGPLY